MLETALTLVSPPAEVPVSLTEIKTHSRIDEDLHEEDPLLEALARAATEWAETFLRRALVTQTWELALPWFPSWIEVPKPPLQSVTSITYTDPDGASQTLATSVYTADTRRDPGRIVLAYGQSWPSTRPVPNAVVVRFVCGYGGVEDVPDLVKRGILMRAADLYEHRESFVTGTIVSPLSVAAERLLWPCRSWTG